MLREVYGVCRPGAAALALAFLCLVVFLAGCGDSSSASKGKIVYVATVHPVYEILEEVTAGRAEVIRLLHPSASPHTYEPRPSDARAASSAKALFYVADGVDGWASRLRATTKIQLMDFLPKELEINMTVGDHAHCADPNHAHHDHDELSVDPHFWTDPLAVKAILPGLVTALVALDPEGADVYRANANSFSARLDSLNAEVAEILQGVSGEKVLLFHPSFQYLLRRYGLEYAGSIEPFPGKEPTPRYLSDMIERIQRENIRAVFTEPQLSPRPAEMIAEAGKLQVYQLDPYGGLSGTEDYGDYLLYNARVLAEALK